MTTKKSIWNNYITDCKWLGSRKDVFIDTINKIVSVLKRSVYICTKVFEYILVHFSYNIKSGKC